MYRRFADSLRFVHDVAQRSRDAGVGPLDAVRQTDLGRFGELLDSERVVGNLHRAYAELDGAAPGAPIDLVAALRDMVTDHDDWPVADVVAAYHSQNDAEQGFRQLKDPDLVGFSPMFH